MTGVIGWDIGGAHLKAARAQGGRIVAVTQQPCTPHLGLAFVEQAIRDASAILGSAERHAVTMTAELSDAFEDRLRGVASIAAIFAHEIGAPDIRFYAGAAGLVAKTQVALLAQSIASANWRASADLVARAFGEALFVDMGSTTTDIIPIRANAVSALGADDGSRLAHGELVYTGLLRGSPAAGLLHAPVAGRWTPLVDENFATMADVHRILQNIPAGADIPPTVDGRARTAQASRVRLARMVGRDAGGATPSQWDALARFFARAQLRRIEDQIALLASRDAFYAGAPVVGAGVGRSVIADWARRTGRTFHDFDEFIVATPQVKAAASNCAPACAVALLASETPPTID
jgi:(4-(4-[2-(gamma-L-glutamylamino)ethyl]phenoxymethyl)furan-2-yl)methanamine synthase